MDMIIQRKLDVLLMHCHSVCHHTFVFNLLLRVCLFQAALSARGIFHWRQKQQIMSHAFFKDERSMHWNPTFGCIVTFPQCIVCFFIDDTHG